MSIVGDASIVVDADTNPFQRKLKGDVEKSASATGGIIKGILGAAVITEGARSGLDFLKGSIEQGREAQRVGNLTAAVIKSTGDASKLSAKQFEDLATQLSQVAGVDKLVIQNSENVLATFTNVKNGLGKGNDIFTQTETATLNLSKALGEDLQTATIQVGKAVNDPIKGIGALRRVGVSFTAQQIEQVKALVKSGQTLTAQKLILKELGTEFGGAAAASTNAGARLAVTVKNIQEEIGKKLLPVVDKIANFLADHLPGALDAGGRAFTRAQTVIAPFIAFLRENIPKAVAAAVAEFGKIRVAFAPFVETLQTQVLPAAKQVASFIADNLKPILIGLAAAALVIAGPFVAIGAAFVLAYTHSQTFRDIVATVITDVSGFVGDLVRFVQTNLPKFEEAFSHVVNAVIAVFHQMKGTITLALQAVQLVVTTVFGAVVGVIKQVVLFVTNLINGDFASAFGNLKNIVGIVVGAVVDLIKGLPGKILGAGVGVISALASLGGDILGGLLRGIKDKVGDVLSGIKEFVLDKIPKFVKDFFGISSPSTVFAEIGGQLMGGLARGIIERAGEVISAIKNFVLDKVPGFVKHFFGIGSPSKMFAEFGTNLMEGLALGIRDGGRHPLSALDDVNTRLASARASIPPPTGFGGLGGTAGTAAGAAVPSVTQHITVNEVHADPNVTARKVAAIAGAAARR